jgi:hypothetical protein
MSSYISALIYLMATISLLIGTLLNFDERNLSDYFYLSGTSLFVLNSIINLNNSYKQYYKNYEYLSPLIIDEEYNTN